MLAGQMGLAELTRCDFVVFPVQRTLLVYPTIKNVAAIFGFFTWLFFSQIDATLVGNRGQRFTVLARFEFVSVNGPCPNRAASRPFACALSLHCFPPSNFYTTTSHMNKITNRLLRFSRPQGFFNRGIRDD